MTKGTKGNNRGPYKPEEGKGSDRTRSPRATGIPVVRQSAAKEEHKHSSRNGSGLEDSKRVEAERMVAQQNAVEEEHKHSTRNGSRLPQKSARTHTENKSEPRKSNKTISWNTPQDKDEPALHKRRPKMRMTHSSNNTGPSNTSSKRTAEKRDQVARTPRRPKKTIKIPVPQQKTENRRKSTFTALTYTAIPSEFDTLENPEASLFEQDTVFNKSSYQGQLDLTSQRLTSAELKSIPKHSLATNTIDDQGNLVDSEFKTDLIRIKDLINSREHRLKDSIDEAKRHLRLDHTISGIKEPLSQLENNTELAADAETYLRGAKDFKFKLEGRKEKNRPFAHAAIYFMRFIDKTTNYTELQNLFNCTLKDNPLSRDDLSFLSQEDFKILEKITTSSDTSPKNKTKAKTQSFAQLMGQSLASFIENNHNHQHINIDNLECSLAPFLVFQNALQFEVHLISRQIKALSRKENLELILNHPTEHAPKINSFLDTQFDEEGKEIETRNPNKQKPEYVDNIAATLESIEFLYEQLYSNKSSELGAVSSDLASRHATVDGVIPTTRDEYGRIKNVTYSEVQVDYVGQAQDTYKHSASLTTTWGPGWGKSYMSDQLPIFLSAEIERKEQMAPQISSSGKTTKMSPQPTTNQKPKATINIPKERLNDLKDNYFIYLDHNTNDLSHFVQELNNPSDYSNQIISIDEFTFMHRLLTDLKKEGWHCSETSDVYNAYINSQEDYYASKTHFQGMSEIMKASHPYYESELEEKRTQYQYNQAAYYAKARFDIETAIHTKKYAAYFYQGSESPDIFQEQYDELIKEIRDQRKSHSSEISKKASAALFEGPNGSRLEEPPFLNIFSNLDSESGKIPLNSWRKKVSLDSASFEKHTTNKDYLTRIAWNILQLCDITEEAKDTVQRLELKTHLVPDKIPNSVQKRISVHSDKLLTTINNSALINNPEKDRKVIESNCRNFANNIVKITHNKDQRPGYAEIKLNETEEDLVKSLTTSLIVLTNRFLESKEKAQSIYKKHSSDSDKKVQTNAQRILRENNNDIHKNLGKDLETLLQPFKSEYWSLDTINFYQNNPKLLANKSEKLYPHGNSLDLKSLYEATKEFFTHEPEFEPLYKNLQLDFIEAQKAKKEGRISQNDLLKKKDRSETIAFEADSSKTRLDKAKETFKNATLSREYPNIIVLKDQTQVTKIDSLLKSEVKKYDAERLDFDNTRSDYRKRIEDFNEKLASDLKEGERKKLEEQKNNLKGDGIEDSFANVEQNLKERQEKLTHYDITDKVQHISIRPEITDEELLLYLENNKEKVAICQGPLSCQVCYIAYEGQPSVTRLLKSEHFNLEDKQGQDYLIAAVQQTTARVEQQKSEQNAADSLTNKINLQLTALEAGDKVQYLLPKTAVEDLVFTEEDLKDLLKEKNSDVIITPERDSEQKLCYRISFFDDQGDYKHIIKKQENLETNEIQRKYLEHNPGKKAEDISYLGFYTEETSIGGDQKDASIGVTKQYMHFEDKDFLYGEEPLTWHYIMQFINRNRSYLGSSLKELTLVIPNDCHPELETLKGENNVICHAIEENTIIHNKGSVYGYKLARREALQQEEKDRIEAKLIGESEFDEEERRRRQSLTRMERRRSIEEPKNGWADGSDDSPEQELTDGEVEEPAKVIPIPTEANRPSPVKPKPRTSGEEEKEKTEEEHIEELKKRFLKASLTPEHMDTVETIEDSQLIRNIISSFEEGGVNEYETNQRKQKKQELLQSVTDLEQNQSYISKEEAIKMITDLESKIGLRFQTDVNPGKNVQHVEITDKTSDQDLIAHLETTDKKILLCQNGDTYQICYFIYDHNDPKTSFLIKSDKMTTELDITSSISAAIYCAEEQDGPTHDQENRTSLLNKINLQLTTLQAGDKVQYFLPQTSSQQLDFAQQDIVYFLENKQSDIVITPENQDDGLCYRISFFYNKPPDNDQKLHRFSMKAEEFNQEDVLNMYLERNKDKDRNNVSYLQFCTQDIALEPEQVTKQYMHLEFIHGQDPLTWNYIIERNKSYSENSPRDFVVVIPNGYYQELADEHDKEGMIPAIYEAIDENTRNRAQKAVHLPDGCIETRQIPCGYNRPDGSYLEKLKKENINECGYLRIDGTKYNIENTQEIHQIIHDAIIMTANEMNLSIAQTNNIVQLAVYHGKIASLIEFGSDSSDTTDFLNSMTEEEENLYIEFEDKFEKKCGECGIVVFEESTGGIALCDVSEDAFNIFNYVITDSQETSLKDSNITFNELKESLEKESTKAFNKMKELLVNIQEDPRLKEEMEKTKVYSDLLNILKANEDYIITSEETDDIEEKTDNFVKRLDYITDNAARIAEKVGNRLSPSTSTIPHADTKSNITEANIAEAINML